MWSFPESLSQALCGAFTRRWLSMLPAVPLSRDRRYVANQVLLTENIIGTNG
jgi:hypothetical protein